MPIFTVIIFSFFFRFPFFFKDIIDWDESTFILMGQSILDGHLPYLKIWDNKPPLIFVIFAGFIKIFGHDIVGIRVGGTLSIAFFSSFFYFSIDKILGKKIALFVALLCVALVSLLSSGQAVTSEHVALLGVMPAFYLLTTKDYRKPLVTLGVGFCLGCAMLIRLNLAYLSLFVGVWLLITFLMAKEKKSLIFQQAIAYIVGHGLIIFPVFLPYLLQGVSDVWWKSVVLAPLAYSTSQGSVLKSILSILFIIGDDVLIFAGNVGMILSILYFKSHYPKLSPPLAQYYVINFVFYFAIAFSIFKSGAVLGHYLIQVIPFLSLAIGLNLRALFQHQYRRNFSIVLLVCIFFLMIIRGDFPLGKRGYPHLFDKISHQQNIREGTSFVLADYLKSQEKPPTSLFILGAHLTHWHTQTLPLNRCVTHPSNLFRESLLPFCGMNGENSTSLSEIQYILQQQPDYILMEISRFKLIESDPEVYAFWQNFIRENYQLISENHGHWIYQFIEDKT